MGCSRPGALAIGLLIVGACIFLLSLVLPYWSSALVPTTRSDVAFVELTFGLWASCIHTQKGNWSDFLRSVDTISAASKKALKIDESVNQAAFSCASYFSHEVASIRCNSLSDFLNGHCHRQEMAVSTGLCSSPGPWDELQANTQLDANATQVWETFLTHTCSGSAQTTLALIILASIGIGLAFVLLVLGITCGPIDSKLVNGGAIAALGTSGFQALVAIIWSATRQSDHKNHHSTLGSCFYLHLTSLLFIVGAALAAQKHRRLEKEAIEALLYDQDDGGEDLEQAKNKAAAVEPVQLKLMAV